MRINVWPADVVPQLSQQVNPVSVLWRPRTAQAGTWRILQRPVAPNSLGEEAWSFDTRSVQIRIPLFPYRLPSVEPVMLTTLGLQVSSAILGSWLPDVAKGLTIEELVMVHSAVFNRDDGKVGHQVWLGVAICTL